MTPLTKVPSVQGGVGGGACGGQTRAWPGCQGVERQGPLLGLTPKGSLTMQPRAPQAGRRGCGRGQGVQLGPGALPPLRPLRPHPCIRQSPHLTCSLLYLCFTSRRIYPHRAWQACLSPPPPPPSRLDSGDARSPGKPPGSVGTQACRGRPEHCQQHLEPSAGQDNSDPAPLLPPGSAHGRHLPRPSANSTRLPPACM